MDTERTRPDIKETKVYSEKYNVEGTIYDTGFSFKLVFSYDGRVITMGLSSKLNRNYQKDGEQLIDSYIDNLYVKQDDIIRLNNWYLQNADSQFVRIRGVVTGHPEFNDGVSYWSAIERYEVDYDNNEMRAYFENLVYHCPLANMNFRKQNKRDPEHVIFPEFEEVEKRYKGKRPVYDIVPGNVLLVLSNDEEYYFNTLYCKPDEDSEVCEYKNKPHIGSYQDSYLVRGLDSMIDIRYFPHYKNMEFYVLSTSRMPLFIENIGDTELYCRIKKWQIKLSPHTRVEICEDNYENEQIILAGGDLYPAAFLF